MSSPVKNRERIEAAIDVDASPAAVWAVVSDLRRMGEWSPQCRRMVVRGGAVRQDTRTLNINRKGWKVWPTRSVVKVFDPERELALRILDNGTIWTYRLEPIASGTRLTETRTAPHGVKTISNRLVGALLGGVETFEAELEQGMTQTLRRIKSAAERG